MKFMNTSVLNFKYYSLSLLLGCFLVLSLNSCVQTKQIVYFQGDTSRYISLKVPVATPRYIQPSDILGVLVTSISTGSNELFNAPLAGNMSVSNYSQNPGQGRNQPFGYLVDSLGNIVMPLIGKINVKDKTIDQAALLIEAKLKDYLKEPSVSVRIANHKFSVLGEVNRPSVYNIIEDRLTLTEALGMAGDLTIFGKRENVLLIREGKNGLREMVRIDLTKRDILTSPYYYVQPNDVIYVEPLKTKATVTDQSYQLVPIFTGIVSALGILILNLRN